MKLAKFTFILIFVLACLSAKAFTVGGINYSITNSTNKTVSVAQGNYSGNIVIPDKVTYDNVEYTVTGVSLYAFKESMATSITLPNTVVTIGMLSFQSCDRLITVNLSENLVEIPAMAFDGCGSLNTIKIPSATRNLGIAAFQNCSSLDEVIFPENSSLQKLDMSVFNGCISLESITLPNSITTIDSYLFTNCTSLKYVKLPDNIPTIGNRMFNNCIALESIAIPNSVSSIEDEAFAGCTGLKKIILPVNTYLSFGKNIWAQSDKLEEIYYGADIIFPANVNNFSDVTYTNATLYISEAAKETVSKVKAWSEFQKVEVYDVAGVATITSDDNDQQTVYNLNGIKVGNSTDNLPAGIYIIRKGNKVEKVIKK